jgi:two-component system, sensor histidine kinase
MARSRSSKKTAAKVSRRQGKQREPERPIFIKQRPAKPLPGKPSDLKSPAAKSFGGKTSAAKAAAGKSASGRSAGGKSSVGKSPAGKSPGGKFAASKSFAAKPPAGKSARGKSSPSKPAPGKDKKSFGKPAKFSAAKPSPAKPVEPAVDTAAAAEASLVAYAHDIRTALTGILALSELLATSTTGERERRWAVGIKGSAEHLSGLTTLMIDAAQARGGELRLQEDVFDLRELIAAVANSLSGRAETKDLVTEVAVAEDLPERVRGDLVRLRAALENLIDNAVKFTERGKVRLEISAEPAKRGRTTLVFSLSDTGIGLKPGEIHRLFRPFTQANADIARRYGGTGLGLVVVKALAKRMGGDLTVVSSYGEGSTFRFAVQVKIADAAKAAEPDEAAATPQRDANSEIEAKDANTPDPIKSEPDASGRDTTSKVGFASDAKRNAKFNLKPRSNAKLGSELKPATPPPEKPPAPRLSVLCVEDNPYGRVILNTLLTELGHRADFASTGEEAVAAMTRAYEAVLMDMTLPGIDGLEATRRIRALEAPAGETPVIGISGRSEPGDEAAAQAAGINAYLRKPLSPKALSDALSAVLPKPV